MKDKFIEQGGKLFMKCEPESLEKDSKVNNNAKGDRTMKNKELHETLIALMNKMNQDEALVAAITILSYICLENEMMSSTTPWIAIEADGKYLLRDIEAKIDINLRLKKEKKQ